MSSSVLSPEAFSASPSDTFADLSGNVPSTASRPEWWTTRLTAGRTVAGCHAELTGPVARLGQFAASVGFGNARGGLAIRGEVNHINALESTEISCQLSVTQFRTCNRQIVATCNGNLNFRRSASASQTIAGVKYPCCSKKEGAGGNRCDRRPHLPESYGKGGAGNGSGRNASSAQSQSRRKSHMFQVIT